ncbi:hybrid sensor histidine kinase/response regulator [Malonomonas rubra]|nr:PAS domain S-box protein [Malonomonas rubra]
MAAIWTLLLAFSTWNQIRISDAGVFKLAQREALVSYNKDLVYRRWATDHGGVYVPVTEQTPPNPYLSHVSNRDITTPAGQHLTLLNPAYMTRQVHELSAEQYGVKGHITSLKPLRPENTPDPWEEKQLQNIHAGKMPTWQISMIADEEHLRMLYPMITEEKCLKCHAHQGYKIGDIRGGISVSVPMANYNATNLQNLKIISLTNSTIWLLGISAIFWIRRYVNRQFGEQGQLREAAEASQKKFQVLFDDAPYGVGIADSESGKILTCNQELLRITGYSEEELIGQPQAKLHPTNGDGNNYSESFKKHLLKPGGTTLVTQVLTKRGELRDVEIKTSRLEMDGKQVLHGFFNDITEQKAITDALRLSEEKFASAFGHAPIMITISNLEDGTYLDANAKFYQVTGFSKEEVIGRTSTELGWITPETREQLIEVLRRDGRAAGMELETRGKDGSVCKCSYFGEIIEVSGQKRLLSLALDITEQRDLEERLLQGEKLQAIGLLAGGIAHDFNNQLSAVLGYAELMELKAQDDQTRSFAQKIKIAAKRAADVTQQLLAFSRKKDSLELPIKIDMLVNEVASILEHSIDKKIRIRKNFDAIHSTVLGDVSQLQNALLNIAINARDAMPNGGELSFKTDLKKLDEKYCQTRPEELAAGTYLQLQITDTGTGIEPENLKKIFDPFFTTKDIGKGTGMGLASAYGTLRSHHGFIEVSSELGIGTTFSLYLPLLIEQDMEAVLDTDSPLPRGEGKILLVDDEELVRKVSSAMLAELGYQVKCFPDGEAAFEYYRSNWRNIDLVILDMIMPKLNGLETYAAMKQVNPAIKVIMASGYSGDKEIEEILQNGILGFVSKPMEHQELASIIARVLKK